MSDLNEGNPATYLKILHHVTFSASNAFVKLLQGRGVNTDIQFLPDGKFFRNLSLMLVDVFAYRVKLSNDQFFESGFSEQKMLLPLEIYDIIKKVKKHTKVEKTLQAKDSHRPHPCDLADKGYGLVDHK
jgi:hypothetical protein